MVRHNNRSDGSCGSLDNNNPNSGELSWKPIRMVNCWFITIVIIIIIIISVTGWKNTNFLQEDSTTNENGVVLDPNGPNPTTTVTTTQTTTAKRIVLHNRQTCYQPKLEGNDVYDSMICIETYSFSPWCWATYGGTSCSTCEKQTILLTNDEQQQQQQQQGRRNVNDDDEDDYYYLLQCNSRTSTNIHQKIKIHNNQVTYYSYQQQYTTTDDGTLANYTTIMVTNHHRGNTPDNNQSKDNESKGWLFIIMFGFFYMNLQQQNHFDTPQSSSTTTTTTATTEWNDTILRIPYSADDVFLSSSSSSSLSTTMDVEEPSLSERTSLLQQQPLRSSSGIVTPAIVTRIIRSASEIPIITIHTTIPPMTMATIATTTNMEHDRNENDDDEATTDSIIPIVTDVIEILPNQPAPPNLNLHFFWE